MSLTLEEIVRAGTVEAELDPEGIEWETVSYKLRDERLVAPEALQKWQRPLVVSVIWGHRDINTDALEATLEGWVG